MSEVAMAAAEYFKNHGVLLRLVKEFSSKYRSLGHFGGTVRLIKLNQVEQADLAAFLRRDTGRTEAISFREFEAAWGKTRFGSLELGEFILAMLPKNFISKKEERQQEQLARHTIHEGLMKRHTSSYAHKWLQALADGQLRLHKREQYLDKDLLHIVATGLDAITEEYIRLPIFANYVAGNPHCFDMDQPAGRLLLQALAYFDGISVPVSADERTNLLYKYHIIRDDILNFATVYGLTAYTKTGKELIYWRKASETYSPLNIPLREISLAERVAPINDFNVVYIVENSGIFSALLDKLQEKKQIVPLVALHGQLKAASWALLDGLVKSGVKLKYSGDFDPEGISIAQHILSRYENAELWHMSVDEYQQATVELPENRQKKLPGAVHPKLDALVKDIIRRKRVLYQESLLDKMYEDLAT